MRITSLIPRLLNRQNTQFDADIRAGNSDLLTPAEIRLLTETSELECIREFASSSRIHAVDAKGDTPLHLAARLGNLALCDIFVQAGANPNAQNNEQQTPADLAEIEGHSLVAQLLSSLVQRDDASVSELCTPEVQSASEAFLTSEFKSPAIEEINLSDLPESSNDYLDQDFTFRPEEDPETFRRNSVFIRNSGSFKPVAPPISSIETVEGPDWEIDLVPVQISGDAIGSFTPASKKQGGERDFLKLTRGGKKSTKIATLSNNTRISIDADICSDWVSDVFQFNKNKIRRSFCTDDDVGFLIKHCEGNVDADELRANILRLLEISGCAHMATGTSHDREFWDAKSDVDFDDLVEAIEAALTRATCLPGTQLFDISRADEEVLLEPMIRAKQDLLLNILASQYALGTIISAAGAMHEGLRDAVNVTLRPIFPTRVGHPETDEFFQNVETLKQWIAAGRVMDGKQRREALNALDALDLTLMFMREIARVLVLDASTTREGTIIDNLITVHEVATQKLILSHLPYVRRFSSRYVESGEDPEDVFQVAFIGLQSSTRRFDPERGVRFVIYSAFWMRQAISRWRADEGAQIRVPVHRSEKLAKLDAVIEKRDIRSDRGVFDAELAEEVDVSLEEVKLLRGIPRISIDIQHDDWDIILPSQEIDTSIEDMETQRIVADVLEDLNDRQRAIIKMRFGIGQDNEMTLEEIGQMYGVTRERIRQIEAKALVYLSHPARKSRLKTLLGL